MDEHPFAQYVRILGKGKSGTRSLTFNEACDAFGMILKGEVEQIQLGAFLMLLRVKEETGEELAGFVAASRKMITPPPATLSVDLDWSSYAGKKNQHPWYILAILLLAQAGYRVLIHGTKGHTANRLYTEQAFEQLGLPIADHWASAASQLEQHKFCYYPLEKLCCPLDDLIQLRHLLGLRSPVHTLTRMLNPTQAHCSIQSVFHPAYAALHQQADQLLEQPRSLVFKGDGGEVEIKPQADTQLMFSGHPDRPAETLQRVIDGRVPAVDTPNVDALVQLWRAQSSDNYGLEAVLGTTAAALMLLNPETEPAEAREQAVGLWTSRDIHRTFPCH